MLLIDNLIAGQRLTDENILFVNSFIQEKLNRLYSPALLKAFEQHCRKKINSEEVDDNDYPADRLNHFQELYLQKFIGYNRKAVSLLGPEINFKNAEENTTLCWVTNLSRFYNIPFIISNSSSSLEDIKKEISKIEKNIEGNGDELYHQILNYLRNTSGNLMNSNRNGQNNNEEVAPRHEGELNNRVSEKRNSRIYDELSNFRELNTKTYHTAPDELDEFMQAWNEKCETFTGQGKIWTTKFEQDKLTKARNIENHEARIVRLAELLGLSDTIGAQTDITRRFYILVKITFNLNDIKGKFFKPTIFSNGHKNFYASSFMDKDGWGYTVDLKAGDNGLVEAVAPEEIIDASNFQEFEPIGIFPQVKLKPGDFPAAQLRNAAQQRFFA